MIRLIRKVRSRCYRTAKVLGDVQAVMQGRIVHRVGQRVAGKATRKGLNKVLPRRAR